MTINYSKQVLLKRGNTAVSSTYVGPLGEVTYDTDLHQIRVHDGERAGGWIVPGGPEYDLLVPLIGNAVTQQTQIDSLFANANVQQAFIESIVNQGNTDPGTDNETFWFNTEDGRLYIKWEDMWVDSSPTVLPSPGYITGIMSDFAGNIVPAANVTYSLGTQEAQWKDLWISNNTIYIGNTPITVSNGSLLVDGNVVSGGGGDRLTNGNYEVLLDNEGNLSVPDRITFGDGSWQSTAFIGTAYNLKNSPTGNLYVTLDDSGTINTPLLLPITFTAVLDSEHMIDAVGFTDAPWEFEVQFQVGPDGEVISYLGNNTPFLVNPGYVDGYEFEYTETDHGIPGYTFTITLNDVVQAGPAGWTTNPAVSQPPEYPSTISSLGAIKLSTMGSAVVPGQEIIASDTQGGITNDFITVWVEGGGTNYPEIVAVQPGWTVVGEGLNNVIVTGVELITQFPGSVIYRITTTISSAKMGYEYTFIEPDGSEPELQNWVFGTDGQLTVPGAIRKNGSLYMNSGGETNSATVLVFGDTGSVILRTGDGSDTKSLTFDVTGQTSFPSSLQFSDGSSYDNSTLTGAIDSDLGLEIKRIITVSGVAAAGSTTGTLIVDISEDDDITVVLDGWEINAGTEIAPIWMVVTETTVDPGNTYEIVVPEFEFEPGNEYTFRNPVPESIVWTIRSQSGGLAGPGGAIVTNETYPLGGGGTYRELAIELPTPDGLDDKRWVFANDGSVTFPDGTEQSTAYTGGDNVDLGNLAINGSTIQSETSGNFVNLDVDGESWLRLGTYGSDKLQLFTDWENNPTIWEFSANGELTFPGGNITIASNIVGSGTDAMLGSANAAVGVIAQGELGSIGLQWIENGLSNLIESNIAGVVVNSPAGSTPGTVQILTGNIGQSINTWEFGAGGNLILPGNIQSTVGVGPVTVTSNDGTTDRTWTFGTNGNLTLPAGGNLVTSTGGLHSISLDLLKSIVASSATWGEFQSKHSGSVI